MLLAALRIPTAQAGHTPVHHDDSRGTTLGAKLRTSRKFAFGKSILLLGLLLKFLTLQVDQLLLLFIQFFLGQ